MLDDHIAPPETGETHETGNQSAPELDTVLNEVATLKSQLTAQERQQRDLERFLLNRNGQVAQEPTDLETLRQKEIEALAKDPLSYREGIVSQAVAQLSEQLETQKLLTEARQKHSDLLPFESLVYTEAQSIWAEKAKEGKPVSEAQAIDLAADSVRAKIKSVAGVAQNTASLRSDALRLSPIGSQPPSAPKDISEMTPAEFKAYDAEVRARFGR